MRHVLSVLALSAGCTYVCEPAPVVVPTADFFADVSAVSGIQEGNFDPDPPVTIPINDHSRLTWSDLDGDGLPDAVMHSLLVNPQNGIPYEHLVFRNNGDGTFADVSDASGLRDVQAGMFAFADVDNDGDQDVYAGIDLAGYTDESGVPYTSGLYLNDGTGVFTRKEASGLEVGGTVVAGAIFGDFDGDANVDLFVANGSTMAGVEDVIYWGRGDGTFEGALLQSGPNMAGNGAVACDIDGDGDQDLAVANYGVSNQGAPNFLWRNDGGRQFTEVGVAWGMARLATGNRWMAETGNGTQPEPGADENTWIGSNSFGIDCGDVDGDGRNDLWVSTISHPDPDYTRQWSDPSHLLLNRGDHFEDVTADVGIPFNEGDIDGALVDFDNDGRLDISVTRESKYEARYTTEEQKGWVGLFHQQPDGTFVSVGLQSGINDLERGEHTRGRGSQNVAWADIELDGDLDLLLGGRGGSGGRPNFLLENTVGQDNRWMMIEIQGDGVNVARDAFGTQVRVVGADREILREKKSGRGTYTAADERRVHIGLGDMPCGYALEVRWPDGTEVRFEGPRVAEGVIQRLSYPDSLEVVR